MPRINGYKHSERIGEEGWIKEQPDGLTTIVKYEKPEGSKHYLITVAEIYMGKKQFLRAVTPLMDVEVEDAITLEPESRQDYARNKCLDFIEAHPNGLEDWY